MKKIIFCLLASLTLSMFVNATIVEVALIDGRNLEGKLLERTDTSLTVIPKAAIGSLVITAEYVKSFHIVGLGRFSTQNGRFVPDKNTLARLEKLQTKEQAHITENNKLSADPNYVIGRALKQTGATALGLGIPCFITGTILVAIGNRKNPSLDDAKCAAAGYVLMPMGGALTIVGIPLYVHGKRIGELNFNYTGNGAGLAMNF